MSVVVRYPVHIQELLPDHNRRSDICFSTRYTHHVIPSKINGSVEGEEGDIFKRIAGFVIEIVSHKKRMPLLIGIGSLLPFNQRRAVGHETRSYTDNTC